MVDFRDWLKSIVYEMEGLCSHDGIQPQHANEKWACLQEKMDDCIW